METSRLALAAESGVTYKFLAGGAYGATGSLVFHLVFSANGPPLIASQPVNQTVAVGSNATFSVSATSQTPLSYFWKRGGSFMDGANSPSYTLLNAQMADSGSQFSCLVSNAYGTKLSASATLSVAQTGVALRF